MNDSDRLVNPLNTMISSPFQANVYSPQFGHGRVSPPQPFNCYLGNCPLDRDLFEPHEEDEHPVISPAAIEKCQAFLTEINTLLESQSLLSSQSACDLEDRHPSPALILDQYPALLTAVNAFIHVNIPENQMLKMNL